VLAGVVIVVLIALLFDLLLVIAGRLLMPWRPAATNSRRASRPAPLRRGGAR
jgi:osmoprotectant transport system permease protein